MDENNFYTEVHRDSRMIAIDINLKGSVNFNQLEPNESTTIPFFFNDTKNAQKHINSNYEIPKLAPGKYKIIAGIFLGMKNLQNTHSTNLIGKVKILIQIKILNY